MEEIRQRQQSGRNSIKLTCSRNYHSLHSSSFFLNNKDLSNRRPKTQTVPLSAKFGVKTISRSLNLGLPSFQGSSLRKRAHLVWWDSPPPSTQPFMSETKRQGRVERVLYAPDRFGAIFFPQIVRTIDVGWERRHEKKRKSAFATADVCEERVDGGYHLPCIAVYILI